MKWNANDKVKLALGVVVLFFLIIGGLFYVNIRRLETNTEWVDRSHRIIHSLQKMFADLKDAQANYADFLLTRNKNFAKSCETDISNIDRELDQTNNLILGDILWRQSMEDLRELVGKKLTTMRVGLDYARTGHPDLAIRRVQNGDEKTDDKEIKDLVGKMTGFQVWLLKTRKDFEDASTQKGVRLMAFGSLAAFLLCAFAAFLINRQINERQAALNRLRSSEEKFRFLAENATEAFVTSDQSGNIVDCNPSAEIMYGYRKADLVGQSLTCLMPRKFLTDNGDRSFDQFIALTKPKSGPAAIELYARRKDGSEFPVEVSVSMWETKGGTFYTSITRDITERKFFMKMILKNEHRLFQFLEAIPVGVVVRDREGMPYYANQAAKDLLGRDIMSEKVPPNQNSNTAFVSSSGQPYPFEKLPMVRALAGEKSQVTDMEIRVKGRDIPVQSWGTPIFDEAGQLKFALVAISDATHQKEITDSLQSREEFFRNLFEEGPIGMTLAFPDSTLVNVNRAFSGMLGYSKDDLTGRSFLDFLAPGDTETERLLSQKLFDKLIPKYQIEERYITRKGQTIWCKVSASVIRDINDDPLFRLAVVENITDQKEAETAVRESEEKFRRVFEESPLGMAFIGSDGSVQDINKAFCDMLAYPRTELLKTDIIRVTYPDDVEMSGNIPHVKTASGIRHVEKRYVTKDKRVIWASVTPLLMKEKEGLDYRVLSIVEDITERKQVEEMKRDLIAVVSHQLKTPVAEINGYIENLLEGLAGDLNTRQREYLTDMREIGMENYRLISDLLNMSKIERGVVSVEPQSISLAEIVESSTRDYVEIAVKKGLDLNREKTNEDMVVFADKDKTVEAIRNILNNAIKCTDRGNVRVMSTTEGDFGVVNITDTGIGMSSETMKRLFSKERVMGAEASRSGAGLGLFIARSFMKLQGGDISVESEPGKGSCFRVKIPRFKRSENA